MERIPYRENIARPGVKFSYPASMLLRYIDIALADTQMLHISGRIYEDIRRMDINNLGT